MQGLWLDVKDSCGEQQKKKSRRDQQHRPTTDSESTVKLHCGVENYRRHGTATNGHCSRKGLAGVIMKEHCAIKSANHGERIAGIAGHYVYNRIRKLIVFQ